jgi:hypothetical protein
MSVGDTDRRAVEACLSTTALDVTHRNFWGGCRKRNFPALHKSCVCVWLARHVCGRDGIEK